MLTKVDLSEDPVKNSRLSRLLLKGGSEGWVRKISSLLLKGGTKGVLSRVRDVVLILGVLALNAFGVQNVSFQPSTITLGDDADLTFDFENGFQDADCWIYLDLNGSGTIDPSDRLMLREEFWDNDGWDESPAQYHYERILTPEEIHQAPAQYLARVEDGGTPGLATLGIIPISSSTSISGRVLEPANTANLVAFLGMTQGFAPPQNVYTCLTDASGEFTINIPDDLAGRFGFFWVSDIADVAPNWAGSEFEFVQVEGQMSGHNVHLHPVSAWVYGQIRDDAGTLLPDGYTVDASSDGPADMGSFQGGWYHVGTTDGPWEVGGESEQLRYDYISAHENITLNPGDSVRTDLVFCRANSTITGAVYMDGSPATRIRVEGSCSLGNTYACSDMNGQYTLHISSLSSAYEIELSQDEIPAGYYPLEQHTGIFPGATGIDFHLMPIPGGVSGRLTVQTGDPVPDYTEFTALAEQEGGGNIYSVSVSSDGSYEIRAPQGLYTLRLGQPYPPPLIEVTHLWTPAEYDSVQVGTTVIPGYDFELNYAQARVEGVLTGLTEYENLMMYGWEGDHPSEYYNAVYVGSDSHYEMRVCEGTWHLIPPDVSGYNVDPPGYIIEVSENDTLFSGYDFDYTSSWVSPEPVDPLASEFQIGACFPNPFNSTVVLTYKIPETGLVTLTACNVLGQRVAVVFKQMVSAGVHQIGWRPEDLATGIYFLELTWRGEVQIAKVMYLR